MKALPLILAGFLAYGAAAPVAAQKSEVLHVIVMDPLALPLSCTCVEGTGQRRYELLGEYLGDQLADVARVGVSPRQVAAH